MIADKLSSQQPANELDQRSNEDNNHGYLERIPLDESEYVRSYGQRHISSFQDVMPQYLA
jgi:hypothetical protein